jgi:uncharacterized protein (TIGR00369 family)
MTPFEAPDSGFAERVRESFDRLTLMQTIGARLLRIAPGEVEIDLPFRDDLTQHHGFLAAAVLTAIADVACGYAAMSLMPAGASVLTIEYKANFVSPARGERLVARSRVVKAGQTLSVCSGDVFAQTAGEEKLVATMLATMMVVRPDRLDARLAERGRREEAHRRPGTHATAHSGEKGRPWCLCRGGRLRQTLRELAGIGR